jgi:hypothetical protein
MRRIWKPSRQQKVALTGLSQRLRASEPLYFTTRSRGPEGVPLTFSSDLRESRDRVDRGRVGTYPPWLQKVWVAYLSSILLFMPNYCRYTTETGEYPEELLDSGGSYRPHTENPNLTTDYSI